VTDREALLRAILENPADDVARLVLADWLQEHGEEDRAGFLREADRHEFQFEGGWQYYRGCGLLSPHVAMLYSELVAADADSWGAGAQATFRGPFMERVSMTTEAFVKHAPSVFSQHPIMKVRLTDLNPEYEWWSHQELAITTGARSWDWDRRVIRLTFNTPDSAEAVAFSGEVFKALWKDAKHVNKRGRMRMSQWLEYRTEKEALDAMSRALVDWGRKKAGLKKLNWRLAGGEEKS
jgi:uncharacterized protein (TIGR02996 family)